jgi:hypothetical protein
LVCLAALLSCRRMRSLVGGSNSKSTHGLESYVAANKETTRRRRRGRTAYGRQRSWGISVGSLCETKRACGGDVAWGRNRDELHIHDDVSPGCSFIFVGRWPGELPARGSASLLPARQLGNRGGPGHVASMVPLQC